jgi:holo-[acyl-carrier protein] synthase
VIGIGIDAVDLARFRQVLERRPRLVERLFSEAEREDVAGRADPVPGLAARFAAKEAAWKALGAGLGAAGFTDVEVVRSPGGAPALRVSRSARRLADQLGVTEWHVSITHTASLAQAVVVAR